MQTLHKLSYALQQRFRRQALPRKPEMDLVMLDREQVDQYNKNGIDGGLAIVYDLIINLLLKISPLSGEALDICCGPAQLLTRTAKTMPEMHFTGLDLSPRMLQFAQENKEKTGVQNVDFKAGSMYELTKLFDKKFDLITWANALHHCDCEENVIRVLDQISQILKKDGCLLIFDFIRPKTGKIALQLSNVFARPFGDWLFQDNLDSYKAAFTYDEIEEILRESQLKGWRHIEPIIGNMFQFVIVSSNVNPKPRKICNLKYAWQKLDYNFLKVVFAGRI